MTHDALFVIAVVILLGTLGANVFKRLHIPQVVAYIVVGIIIGQSGFHIVDKEMLRQLTPINYVALGMIGFLIGGELRRDVFRKHGKRLVLILAGEGMAAFALVTIVTGLITHNWQLAIILGAISSATAPAATVSVLWEYKAMGVLTTAIFAIVALDDGLALILYGFASSIAPLIGHAEAVSWQATIGYPLYQILTGIAIGVACGTGINYVLKKRLETELLLGLGLGAVLLVVGASRMLKTDLILAAMALGVTVANLSPHRSKDLFEAVRRFAPPIYVLFFVFTGARLDIPELPGWVWMTAAGYIVARTAGKMGGAYLAARAARAPRVLQKYLGMSLFSQGGVAIGLAILAFQTFNEGIGAGVVAVITTTTLFVEIIGPPCVRYAIVRAREAGRNVTEEDLIRSHRVRDVMDREPAHIDGKAPLQQILEAIADCDCRHHPVVNDRGELIGLISVQQLMTSLSFEEEGRNLLIAWDLMDPVVETVGPDDWLADTLEFMRDRHIDYLPVVDGKGGKELVGTIELQQIDRTLRDEILKRRGSDTET